MKLCPAAELQAHLTFELEGSAPSIYLKQRKTRDWPNSCQSFVLYMEFYNWVVCSQDELEMTTSSRRLIRLRHSRPLTSRRHPGRSQGYDIPGVSIYATNTGTPYWFTRAQKKGRSRFMSSSGLGSGMEVVPVIIVTAAASTPFSCILMRTD